MEVYENLEKVRAMLARRSTTDYRLDSGIGGSGADNRGLAEGYIEYAMRNAPKNLIDNKQHYRFAVDAYIDFLGDNDCRLFINGCQRLVKDLMGDHKRQYRHRAAIVRIALHQIYRGKLSDDMCAGMLHGGGVSRQVYAETYKKYTTELINTIRGYLEVADDLVGQARRLDRLDCINY